jgi:hypothetical protein
MFATPLHHMAAEPLWNSSARLRRARRVGFLIIVLVGLSIIDLLLTLEYVRTIGMAELNPIAAWIMRQGSTAGLVAWKIGTVMMAATIIYSIRHRVRGEFAAWVCTLILTVLTAHWINYGLQVHEITPAAGQFEEIADARWVVVVE